MAKQKVGNTKINIKNSLEDIKENEIIIEDNLELEEIIPDVQSFEEPDQINNDCVFQDEENLLEFYVKELLVSLEGIFIGGIASQKRDQLISYLYKGNMGGDS